jgi:hypothetical protein
LRSEIFHRGRKVQLAVKPRFHRVLVGGDDVHKMSRLERPNMACDHAISGITPARDDYDQGQSRQEGGRPADRECQPKPLAHHPEPTRWPRLSASTRGREPRHRGQISFSAED